MGLIEDVKEEELEQEILHIHMKMVLNSQIAILAKSFTKETNLLVDWQGKGLFQQTITVL
jgi:hypothetical protein